MKHSAAFVALLVSGAVVLSAQAVAQAQTMPQTSFGVAGTASVSQDESLYVLPQNAAASCPVSLRAQHGRDGNMRAVRGTPPPGVSQAIHLIVRDPASREIRRARVTVRGLTDEPRLSQASSAGEPDLVKTLEVVLAPADNHELAADLRVPGATSIQSVELIAVTYADGSTWKMAADKSCRISPENLMPVGAH